MAMSKRSGVRLRTSSTTRAPAMPLPITTSFLRTAWIMGLSDSWSQKIADSVSARLKLAELAMFDEGLDLPRLRPAQHDGEGMPRIAGETLDQADQFLLP